ncbi:MAG: methyltransferase domain-containing protein [Magnetospirillum sp. WYHS-4]
MNITWNPQDYLKFADERTRAALELLARIPLDAPATVCDLGCGTGHVTRLIAERWPRARVTGVDSSSAMLDEARRQSDAVLWREGDIADWRPEAPLDLIFSNAALHWLDDHGRLFPRLLGSLTPGGVLAVQLPRNFDAPSHTAIAWTVRAGSWRTKLEPLLRPTPVDDPPFYYDLLAPLARRIDIWETIYLQVFTGETPVVDWVRGTALRPFLDALDGNEKEAFLAAYAARVQASYPRRIDGTTLYPMRRLFFVATR